MQVTAMTDIMVTRIAELGITGEPCMVVYHTTFDRSWDQDVLCIEGLGSWEVYPWDNKDLPLPAKITQGDFVYTFD